MFLLLNPIFGKSPFEAEAPIRWKDSEVPKHAASNARRLNADLQALRPLLQGVPNQGFNLKGLFDPTVPLSLELA